MQENCDILYLLATETLGYGVLLSDAEDIEEEFPMTQRICPICDQVMRSRHYCKVCKSWVKHPYVRDVTYYLNERHPAGEADCSYHNREEYTEARPSGGNHASPWIPRQGGSQEAAARQKAAAENTRRINEAHSRKAMSPQAAAAPRTATAPRRATAPQTAKSSKNTGIIVAIVVIFIVIRLISGVFTFFQSWDFEPSRRPEYDVDMGGFYGEEESWNSDYKELEDDEVIAAGVRCNSVGHFDIIGQDAKELICGLLDDYGLSVEEKSIYSYNEEYDDGTTWFVTWVMYELQTGDGGGEQFMELDYDTATGELHQIDLVMEEPEQLKTAVRDILNLMSSHDAILPEENCAQDVEAELVQTLQAGEAYEIQLGSVWVESYYDGNNYAAHIYRMTE